MRGEIGVEPLELCAVVLEPRNLMFGNALNKMDIQCKSNHELSRLCRSNERVAETSVVGFKKMQVDRRGFGTRSSWGLAIGWHAGNNDVGRPNFRTQVRTDDVHWTFLLR